MACRRRFLPKMTGFVPGERRNLPRVLFQMSGHVPPLLRDFDQLLLDKRIAGLFGPLFALERLGAILFCLARHTTAPPVLRKVTNATGAEWFRETVLSLGERRARLMPAACEIPAGRRRTIARDRVRLLSQDQ
jgi:hypothetical protein